ncbi:MAG: hypothetical protein AAF499_04125 [Pseudomonadota bacterium]
MTGWIGVDLDGTLAQFDRWRGPDSIGLPIPAMVKRVEAWVAEGREVRIFTARASDPRLIPPIKRWLKLHGLPDLKITNVKDFQMLELWDDRAVQVIHNTGRAVQPNTLEEQEKPELIDVANQETESATPQFNGETVLEPTEAEVEAFRKAVKSRSKHIDDSLLDALDAGEEYTPSAPESIADAMPASAPTVVPEVPSPAVALVQPESQSDMLFPAVDDTLKPVAVSDEPYNDAPYDEVVLLPPAPIEQAEPVLLNGAAQHSPPKRANGFPPLHVGEEDWDTGIPTLRVENR